MTMISRCFFALCFISVVRCAVVLRYQDQTGKLTVEANSHGGSTVLVGEVDDLNSGNPGKSAPPAGTNHIYHVNRKGKSERIRSKTTEPISDDSFITVDVTAFVPTPGHANVKKSQDYSRRNKQNKQKEEHDLAMETFARSAIAFMLGIAKDGRIELNKFQLWTTQMENYFATVRETTKRRIVNHMVVAKILTGALGLGAGSDQANFSPTDSELTDSKERQWLINVLLSRLEAAPCLKEFVQAILVEGTILDGENGECSPDTIYKTQWYKNDCRLLMEGGNQESRTDVDWMCGAKEVRDKDESAISNKVIRGKGAERGKGSSNKKVGDKTVKGKGDEDINTLLVREATPDENESNCDD